MPGTDSRGNRLLVVRHGESPSTDVYWGTSDVGLSPRGVQSVHELSRALTEHGLTRIAHSPQRRARETASIIAAHLPTRPRLWPEPRLAAKDYGIFNGRAKHEVALVRRSYATDREMLMWAPERGESYWEVFLRIAALIRDVAAERDEVTLVVTHEGPVKVLLSLWEESLQPLRVPFGHGQVADLTALLGRQATLNAWLDAVQARENLPATKMERERDEVRVVD